MIKLQDPGDLDKAYNLSIKILPPKPRAEMNITHSDRNLSTRLCSRSVRAFGLGTDLRRPIHYDSAAFFTTEPQIVPGPYLSIIAYLTVFKSFFMVIEVN